MKMVPVAGFAALSGTGKTTLIEGVIRVLRAKGLRVAAVKHDGHGYEPDREGKDSWRFSRAGAALSVVSAGDKTAWFSEGGKNLAQLLAFMPEMDMILVEGYKREVCRQIGICRLAAGKPLPETPERYEAIATDTPLDTEVPQFSLNDPEGLADFLLARRETFLTPVGPEVPRGEKPSAEQWLREAKALPEAAECGMYLLHNGVVRLSSRAQARERRETAPVRAIDFSWDARLVEEAVAAARGMEGIHYVRVWLNQGHLEVGDDIMQVLVGGDIRPRVVAALEALVGQLKTRCVTETERF